MASQDDPERDDTPVPSALVDVLEDPAEGEHRLPYLLSQVDADDVAVRLAASSALCAVVQANPAMVEYAVGRLVDRLDADASTEVVHTLDYLAAEFPREVDEVLADIETEREETARTRMYRTGGGFARNDYVDHSDPEGHTARARLPRREGSDDPRRAYTEDGEGDEQDREEDGGEDEVDTDGDDQRAVAPPESFEPGADEPEAEDLAEGTLTRSRVAALNDRLSLIVENSRFDSLDILTARYARRYADVYRALGSIDGDARAIGLHVFHLPDTGGESFVDDFRRTISAWADADGHESVHTIHDWGWHPRPWAAVEYTGQRLADREDLSVEEGLYNAIKLAGVVCHLHQQGVVHGAIDPGNVAYVGDVLGSADRQVPLLTNVGLISLYRPYADPVDYLDPAYAAPEYFDDRYGRVDHMTDVYQVGAVLYRLLTGTAPYESAGSLSEVRTAVLNGRPTPPSERNARIPPVLDEVVAKATATEKMARYESVEHLQQELYSVVDSSQSDGG